MDTIETLRLIIEQKHNRFLTRDEALELGESLICYYKTLAGQGEIVDIED